MRATTALLSAWAALAAAGATAQSPPAADAKVRAASHEVMDAEPAVSQAPAAVARPPAVAAPATAPTQAPATAPASGRPAAAAPERAAGADRGARAQDRLELETTQITGNRELPKVMVVVPWKRSDIGDLAGRPVNSLVDEALQPVDREEFRREIDYYNALTPDRPRDETHVTAGAAKQQPEK